MNNNIVLSVLTALILICLSSCGNPAEELSLRATGYESHITLEWDPLPASSFVVLKSSGVGDMLRIDTVSNALHHYVDYLGTDEIWAEYQILALDSAGSVFAKSPNADASTMQLSDDKMLSMVQRATLRYFWDYAHPVSGMARERFPGDEHVVTSGGTGFGIMAILAGIEQGFISRQDAAERVLKIVKFLEQADRFHGAWPHWMDGRTGKVIPFSERDDGGDLVETAFLVQGLLTAREYFSRSNEIETSIRKKITTLWESVEWDWYRREPDSPVLYWHWSPEHEWAMNHQIRGWNETMIVYLLAVSSPTHPVPAELYHTGWAGSDNYHNPRTRYGYSLEVGTGNGGPLFFTHYSFLGFDPREKRDDYANYFAHNRNQTLVNRAYCIENPGGYAGYGPEAWGLTASYDPGFYAAHAPNPDRDNGTLTPTAALSSMPYTPDESMAVLRHFYDEYGESLWGEMGFKDAFNPTKNWVSDGYLAIDQGPIIIMIENYRTELVWDEFMDNHEIQEALDKIGYMNSSD